MWGSVGGSVLGPHTLTHFSRPPPFLSPQANTLPDSPHTGTLSHTPPHTFPLPTHLSLPLPTPQHTSPHTPHTSSPYHLPTHLSLPLPTPQHTSPHTSPYTPTHFPTNPMHSPYIFLHSFDYVAKLRYHVTMLP